jgi:hypothetical protein
MTEHRSQSQKVTACRGIAIGQTTAVLSPRALNMPDANADSASGSEVWSANL